MHHECMNLPNTNSPERAPHSQAGWPSHSGSPLDIEYGVVGDDEARLLTREHASLHAIAPEKIDFIEALGDLIQINADGKGYLKAQRLAEFKMQLDPALFVEVHPTCVVHVSRLPDVEDGLEDGWAVLGDGSVVPVSSEGRNAILRIRNRARAD